jgi:hypothetical protein
MTFSISMLRSPVFVAFTVSGPASIKNFVELMTTVEHETLYWSDRRALMDLREVDGRLTATEQVFLGELVAQNFPHLERMASVVATDKITRNSEKAAQQLGSNLRVFVSREEAEAWLAAEPAG